ncbi:MAG: ABC transporter substrate-binding protein [Nitrospirota bacterium]
MQAKRYFFIFLFIAVTFCHIAGGDATQEIALIKSTSIKPYDEAIRGFKSVCKANVREFTISDLNGTELLKEVRKIRPVLIFAVGMDALSRMKRIKDIPIIYAMVSNPMSMLSGEKNITGIGMNISAEKQLTALLEVSPDIKRIGLIYDPRKTAHLVDEAQSAASSSGIEIVSRKVYSSKEVPSAIKDMKGKIDAFWMLPDITVITQETIEYLLLFSFENSIPILTFSAKYVKIGALMALQIDTMDVGQQAGEMANRIISGTNVGNIPMSLPRKAILSLNLITAKRLGISVDDKIIRKSKIIY